MSFEKSPENDPLRQEHIKRIILPSGKPIEVVSFGDIFSDIDTSLQNLQHTNTPDSPEAEISSHKPDRLCDCPECKSNLVYPFDWEEESHARWRLDLHCPNCDWTHIEVYDEGELLDEFDEELDRGMEELVSDLGRLARANMADDLERFANDIDWFVNALKTNAIQPMDF